MDITWLRDRRRGAGTKNTQRAQKDQKTQKSQKPQKPQKAEKTQKAQRTTKNRKPPKTLSTPKTSKTKRPAKGKATGGGSRWERAREARRRERAAAEARWEQERQPPLSGVARLGLMLVAFVCMVAFAVLLAKVTLVPSPASRNLVHANLHPGASLRAYLDQPAIRDTVKQIGGNIVLGMPFGVLLPVLFPKARGLVRVTAVTAVVMLCVELAQGTLVVGRAFDIDDVILNTSGAILGYVFAGRRLGRSVHPRRRHWWQRPARRRATAE